MGRKKMDIFTMIEKNTSEIPPNRKKLIEEEESFRMNIAIAMVKIRQEIGISQKEAAQRLGVTQSWISKLENANYDHRIESIWKYLKALGADIELTVQYVKNGRKKRVMIRDSKIHEEWESYKNLAKPMNSSYKSGSLRKNNTAHRHHPVGA